MQQISSDYDEQRSLCNQIIECILQPIDLQQIEAYTLDYSFTHRAESLRSTVLTSISQGLSQMLTQNVNSILPASKMESLQRQIFLASQENVPAYSETNRVTLENVMDIFPEIVGEGSGSIRWCSVGETVKEYNSIRKSVQDSITLFNKLKEDLKPTAVPNVPALTAQRDVNAIMRRSQQLCTVLLGSAI